jgi:dihydroorotase
MAMINRREFSKAMVGSGVALAASRKLWAPPASAAANGAPAEPALEPQAVQSGAQAGGKFDLLIKGGTVIDPGQQMHAAMDVAVSSGKVAMVAKDIPETRAMQVVSAKGKIVTPGLIDLHQHCYDGVAQCVNADLYCLTKGVTTVIDAGSAGHATIANFHKYIINTAATRIKALINITPLGAVGPAGNLDFLDIVDPDLAAQAVIDNRPATVGIKVRLGHEIQGEHDVEYLRRGLKAAEAARVPLMAHIDGPYSPLETLLPMMRKGDTYTHFLHAQQHGSLDANGKLLPVVIEARRRGVYFDVGQGRTHLSFDVAEKCLQQGFLPDSISTDLTTITAAGPVFDLPTMVSKFMAIGVDIEKAIAMVTVNPARVFDYGAKIGTLKPGYEADVSVFELRDGNFQFEDSYKKTRTGKQKLVVSAVLHGSQLLTDA